MRRDQIINLIILLVAAIALSGADAPDLAPADTWTPPGPDGWRGERAERHADGSLWYWGTYDTEGQPIGRHYVFRPERVMDSPGNPDALPPGAVAEILDFSQAEAPSLDSAWKPDSPPRVPAGFTGQWFSFDAEGNPLTAGNYENSLAHGVAAVWSPDGFMTEASYVHGVAEGPARGFYPDENLLWEASHREGLREGLMTLYAPDGRITSKQLFSAGRRHGLTTFYGSDGQVEATEAYINDERDGLAEFFDADGRLRAQISWRRGEMNGPWVEYHSNGQRATYREMKDGEQDGWFFAYDEEGQPTERKLFRMGVEVQNPEAEADP